MSVERGVEGEGRTASDATMLLLELDRAVRSRRFFPEGGGEVDHLLERAFRVWKADLRQHGPLELEVRNGGFWLAGGEVAVGRGRLEELAGDLHQRGIEQIHLGSVLERGPFRELIDRLVVPLEARREPARADAAPAAAPGTEREAAEPADDLLLQLRELDEAVTPAEYRVLCRRVVDLGTALVDRGRSEEARRALLVLSAHAGDEGKRPAEHVQEAREALSRLAHGPLLADLVERVASSDGEASLGAVQLSFQIGSQAARAYLDALESEPDEVRCARLSGAVIALAEAALPVLVEAIEEGAPRRARMALRLAGETQHPDLVPLLSRVAAGDEPDRRRIAARALARMGSRRSLQALLDLSRGASPAVAECAVFALGATGSAAAVEPLAATVERAWRRRRSGLAREAVNALGKLARPEAVAPLVALLERRAWRGRRELRELQVAAVSALARLPEDRARPALERATRSRDVRVRRAAQRGLLAATHHGTTDSASPARG